MMDSHNGALSHALPTEDESIPVIPVVLYVFHFGREDEPDFGEG